MSEELDAEIAAAQAEMRQLKDEINEAATAANSNREAEKALLRAERELAQQMAAIREQKNVLARDYQEKQKVVKAKRTTEDELNRRLQKLLNERALQDEFSKLNDELDRLTIGRPWREWAKSHQISGAKHLAASRKAILGDKRGLGKTLTSLIFLDMVRARKTIIFTPKDVSANFASEVQRWTPDRPVIVLTGMNKIIRDTILSGVEKMEDCTLIVNYEAGRKDTSLVERFIQCGFDTVIVDEAHKIKNHTGLDYKYIFQICHAVNQCNLCGGSTFESDLKRGRYCATCMTEEESYDDFRSVKNIIPMTGTVFINRPQDLWPLLRLIDPNMFGSLNRYLHDYCTMDLYTQHWKFKSGGEERLLKSLGMRYLGRTNKTAGVEMPPQKAQHHIVEFDPKAYPRQWAMMQQIKEYGAIKMSDEVALGVPGILAEITRMSQALVWPGGIKMYAVGPDGKSDYSTVIFESDVTESIKLDKAMEIIQQALEEGDRVVLFSRFKEALKELQRRLNEAKISNVRYDGDLRDSAARVAQLDFDIKTAPTHSADEHCLPDCPNWGQQCSGYQYDVFLGQYQKAGTGLNLTGARQMVILDRYFADAYEDQAAGRIQRLDSVQDSIVHIISVVSPIKGKSTIDDWMNALIDEKKEMTQGYDTAHVASDFARAMRDGDIF